MNITKIMPFNCKWSNLYWCVVSELWQPGNIRNSLEHIHSIHASPETNKPITTQRCGQIIAICLKYLSRFAYNQNRLHKSLGINYNLPNRNTHKSDNAPYLSVNQKAEGLIELGLK